MLKKSFILCFFSYVLAFFTAIVVLGIFKNSNPFLAIFLADVSATIVVFVIGTLYKNASFYDPYWSVAPIFIALYWLIYAEPLSVNIVRQVLVFSLLTIWSLRLTFNWARQWRGIKHEDWRYSKLRQSKGKFFWFVNLTGIHLMPTILVFLGSLSLFPPFAAGYTSIGVLDVLAVIITSSAIIIETLADQQMAKFVKSREKKDLNIRNGLWKYSRHPNYFGEILFWWGLYFFALAVDLSYWWMIIGPVSILILFFLVSIPLIEKKLESKPGYKSYQEEVSKLVFWFPKNKG